MEKSPEKTKASPARVTRSKAGQDSTETTEKTTPSRTRRGKTPLVSQDSEQPKTPDRATPSRGRGRPKKDPNSTLDASMLETSVVGTPEKHTPRRGRPPKVKEAQDSKVETPERPPPRRGRSSRDNILDATLEEVRNSPVRRTRSMRNSSSMEPDVNLLSTPLKKSAAFKKSEAINETNVENSETVGNKTVKNTPRRTPSRRGRPSVVKEQNETESVASEKTLPQVSEVSEEVAMETNKPSDRTETVIAKEQSEPESVAMETSKAGTPGRRGRSRMSKSPRLIVTPVDNQAVNKAAAGGDASHVEQAEHTGKN